MTPDPDIEETVDADRPVDLDAQADLDALVDTHSPVLVEFYTDGCGICASMEPILRGVAAGSDVLVATVNPRDDPALIDRFDVRSVPLFVLFVDGDPIARRDDGFVARDDLLAWIDANRD